MSHAACAAAWAASNVMASAFRAHRMVVGGEAAMFAVRPEEFLTGGTAVARAYIICFNLAAAVFMAKLTLCRCYYASTGFYYFNDDRHLIARSDMSDLGGRCLCILT